MNGAAPITSALRSPRVAPGGAGSRPWATVWPMFPTGWWRRRSAGNDTPRICGAGGTHAGHVRERNEDVILVEPELGLYAVLDGMGGHSAGDVAARLAADEIA